MFENKFVSLPSHLKTIEPMEVHRESRTMCNTETSKVISRTDPMIPQVIKRHLREGDKVRLRDFGLMKLEIESDKVDDPKSFKPRKHIKGVRLHFLPESEKGSPKLYKRIKFEKEP